MLRRRTLLHLAPAVILAACTTTKNGDVTNWTIDTHKVSVEGSAILQALGTMLAAPSIAVLLGPNLITARASLAAAEAALSAFDAMTGGSMSATYDPHEAQATILSFIGDVQQVLTLVQQVLPKISIGSVATAIGNYVAAVQALLTFVEIAVGLSSAGITAKPTMTEELALQIAMH
jgi:hypothetical protein